MRYFFRLDRFAKDPKLIGNKAYHLCKIAGHVNICKGIVVSTKLYDKLVFNHLDFVELLKQAEAFRNNDLTEIAYVEKSSKILNKMSFDKEVVNEIKASIKNLSEPLIVRSSATCEDSESMSFAGVFDTFINVKKDAVDDSIKKVFASVFSPRAVKYIASNKVDLKDVKMACIVQEMVLDSKYGVGFFFDHERDGGKRFVIEAVANDPEGVTSGTKPVDTYVVNNETKEILRYKAESERSILFNFEINGLTEIMKGLGKMMYPLDIEWAYSRAGPIILQARKLTTKIPLKSGNLSLGGFPASSGHACGKAVIFNPDTAADEHVRGKDKILVAGELALENASILKEFGGIIVEPAGITSHLSILAREYHIPCVVGVDKAVSIIKEGEEVCLDGGSGDITLPDRKEITIKTPHKATYLNPDKLSLFNYKGIITGVEFGNQELTLYYHTSVMAELEKIVARLQSRYKMPIAEGSPDVWYRYSILLEASNNRKVIKKLALDASKIVRSLDVKEIDKMINYCLKISSKYYKQSEKEASVYVIGDRNSISKALTLALYSFAYWTIASNIVFRDCIEEVLADGNVPELSEYVKHISLNAQHPMHTMGRQIVELMDRLYAIIKRDYGMTPKKATSELKFARSIRSGSLSKL
jgi:phosphohistidine swiveling domain-containing protein